MTFGVADNPANCCTTESADACAFLSCCQWSAGATGSGNRGQTNGNDPGREVVPLLLLFMFPPFVFFERSIWIASRATQMPSIRKEANSLILPRSLCSGPKNRSVKITGHQ